MRRKHVRDGEPLMDPQIVIIDDDLRLGKLIQRYIQKIFGLNSYVYESGEIALSELRKNKIIPDICLIDLHMPGIDGIQLLGRLSKILTNQGCEIVPMSGESELVLEAVSNLAKQYNFKCRYQLHKPFDSKKIYNIISSILNDSSVSQNVQVSSDRLSRSEIESGLSSGCLEVFYQPQIYSTAHALPEQYFGLEALARWRDSTGKLYGPDAFISAAEHYGLINDITWEVTRQSLQALNEWYTMNPATHSRLNVSINFSHDCLVDTNLPEKLQMIASQYNIPRENIIIEVTESRILPDLLNTTNDAQTLEVLTRLRLKGFGLALDDFGTGGSSMEQLRRYPFSKLKIDKSFVHNASSDRAIRLMLETSVRIGKELGLCVVAEGVETQQDLDLVQELGCDVIQGYYYSKPVEKTIIDSYIQLLKY